MTRPTAVITALLAAGACGPSAAPRNPPSTPGLQEPQVRSAPTARPAPVGDSTRLTALSIRERPELGEELAAERVTGTIAVFDSRDNVLVCSDAGRCSKRHLPASTFKIPNAIIALETGVVSDPETLLKWDGKTYANPDWNQDLTLRRAVQVSCVPCFQSVARQIGETRMHGFLARFEYGNQDISGGVDRFWLWGGLRISPIEQLDFLRRLDLGKLPIQSNVRDTVIDLITLDVSDEHLLRGKTGSALKPEEVETIGWFVGWVERGERRVYFATALDGFEQGVDFHAVRRRVTERVLVRLGALGT